MDNWTFQNFLQFTASLIVSIGGAGIIILGLSKWFGDFIANRLLAGQRFKHESELEKIKTQYQAELEKSKLEIEKAKSLFLRYSEKQFQLYNELWKVLWDLKLGADQLWEVANPIDLPKLSNQLAKAKEAIGNNVLIIEEDHYDQLLKLIDRFEQFNFGKMKLVELRNNEAHQVVDMMLNEVSIRQVIHQNGEVKNEYGDLLKEVAKKFRKQIKG